MSYTSELQEVINTVPTFIEYRTFKENLPQGFMIEQDGKKFRPRCYKEVVTSYDTTKGYFYFYNNRVTVTFASYEEAEQYINGVVALLQWMGGIAAHPTTPAQEQTFEDILVEQYAWLVGKVIYYTDTRDGSEFVGRLKQVSRSGFCIEDVTPPTYPEWFAFTQICKVRMGRQTGWETGL